MKFYIKRDNVRDSLAQLETGLANLTFDDNLKGFTVEVEVAASSEVRLPNKLRDQIPKYMMILLVSEGGYTLIKGDADWTKDSVSVKNTGGSSVKAILFFSV